MPPKRQQHSKAPSRGAAKMPAKATAKAKRPTKAAAQEPAEKPAKTAAKATTRTTPKTTAKPAAKTKAAAPARRIRMTVQERMNRVKQREREQNEQQRAEKSLGKKRGPETDEEPPASKRVRLGKQVSGLPTFASRPCARPVTAGALGSVNEKVSVNKKNAVDKKASVDDEKDAVDMRDAVDVNKQQRKKTVKARPVPEQLVAKIKEVGDGEYQLIFPRDDLREFHHLCWAVKPTITSVAVRVVFREDRRGFCVHLPPSDGEDKTEHRYCWTTEPWEKTTVFCNQQTNFLTYRLGRGLHRLLSGKHEPSMKDIYTEALGVIESDCGVHCVVCGTAFAEGIKLWRPSACDDKCQQTLDSYPLAVRLSPLLADSLVFDFLLSCCMSQAKAEAANANWANGWTDIPKFPVPAATIPGIINAFPKLQNFMDAELLLSTPGRHQDAAARGNRSAFLSWMSSAFQACITTAPETCRVPWSDPQAHQLLLLNASLKRQKAFMDRKQNLGVTYGTVAFHGSPSPRLLSILSDALRVPMGPGENNCGIFYAHQPHYSVSYIRNSGLCSWTHSRLKNMMVLFGLELTGQRKPVPHSQGYTPDESEVMIRYIFLMPARKHNPKTLPPARKTISPSMKKTFRRIASRRFPEGGLRQGDQAKNGTGDKASASV